MQTEKKVLVSYRIRRSPLEKLKAAHIVTDVPQNEIVEHLIDHYLHFFVETYVKEKQSSLKKAMGLIKTLDPKRKPTGSEGPAERSAV